MLLVLQALLLLRLLVLQVVFSLGLLQALCRLQVMHLLLDLLLNLLHLLCLQRFERLGLKAGRLPKPVESESLQTLGCRRRPCLQACLDVCWQSRRFPLGRRRRPQGSGRQGGLEGYGVLPLTPGLVAVQECLGGACCCLCCAGKTGHTGGQSKAAG